mmetsp:Transcript_26702/g.55919  ORF Transcript_26702/g.55919 Transcript_26702/m.55919 type:complete len:139 (-) Transcript_26702:89-505(-)
MFQLVLLVLISISLWTARVDGFLVASLQGRALVSSAISCSEETGDEESIPVPITPCTRICRYNANFFDGQVCIGCFREHYEIGNWQSMDASDKYYTLLDALDRLDEATKTDTVDVEATGTSKEELERQAAYWRKQSEQ